MRERSTTFFLVLLVLLSALTAAAAPTTTWSPLDPTPLTEWFGGRVTQQFGYYHHGIDFGVGWGAPIPATWCGQVTYAGPGGGYGNLVIVQDGDWQMLYAHLSTISVRIGQQVEPGTVVGLSGNTGASDGAHLHYEVRLRGTPVDPMTAPGPVAGPVGDFIELHVRPARPGAIPTWADLWTVVQWQSPDGAWQDVEGWQGSIDEVLDGNLGVKRWWVSAEDLGRGPFRWLVYSTPGEDGRELARSGLFRLPDGERAVVIGVWVR